MVGRRQQRQLLVGMNHMSSSKLGWMLQEEQREGPTCCFLENLFDLNWSVGIFVLIGLDFNLIFLWLQLFTDVIKEQELAEIVSDSNSAL